MKIKGVIVSVFKKSFKTFEFDLLLTPAGRNGTRTGARKQLQDFEMNLSHAENRDAQNSGTLAHALEL